jgi:two-component system, OmpR family, phosphate regulon sensor histidine kinase PhoR
VIVELREQIETSERASRESQALFQTISNIAYDLVLVLNEDHIVIAVNRAADALFGQKHPVGEKLSDVIQSAELIEIVNRAKTETEGLETQILLDGSYYRVRTGVMCYANNQGFIGVALQDVTSLVKLNRARRDMVANISHELRTPIQNIRLTIDGLFYDQNRPKRKASIASLRSIARETNALLWLVQELYDLSMIESGQALMKLVPVRLLDVVNDSVARLKDQLQQKHLKVAVHVPEKLIALCDFEQTRRVVMNLIHNAIKWSPENEAITVSASGNGEEITVSVFDNGPGVPEDQRERIFERFYQIDSSRSKREGTGLGLAICKHIVEAHGGTIRAEGNATGSGGRFIFTLLDGGTETPVQAPAVSAGQHDGGLNMLIASRYTGGDGGDEGEIELED